MDRGPFHERFEILIEKYEFFGTRRCSYICNYLCNLQNDEHSLSSAMGITCIGNGIEQFLSNWYTVPSMHRNATSAKLDQSHDVQHCLGKHKTNFPGVEQRDIQDLSRTNAKPGRKLLQEARC